MERHRVEFGPEDTGPMGRCRLGTQPDVDRRGSNIPGVHDVPGPAGAAERSESAGLLGSARPLTNPDDRPFDSVSRYRHDSNERYSPVVVRPGTLITTVLESHEEVSCPRR